MYCNASYFIEFYREYTDEENAQRAERIQESSVLAEKHKKEDEIHSQLIELSETASKLRHDFIVNCNPLKGCTQKQAQIDAYKKLCGFFIKAYINFDMSDKWDFINDFTSYIGMEITDDFEEMDIDDQNSAIIAYIFGHKNWELKSLLALLIALLEACEEYKYYDYQAKYQPCQELDFIYEILCEFGYAMSDTEKQLQNGTHALFRQKSDLESGTA